MRRTCLHKRAQSGGGAATLVVLIAGLILLYLLFLPPDVREELLEGENLTDSDGNRIHTTYDKDDVIILDESPQRLDYLAQNEIEHTLPEIRLFSTTSGEIVFEENSAFLKKSWFAEEFKTVPFSVDDASNLENLLLSFAAPRHEGRLIVLLNGNEIFNNEVTQQVINPVSVKASYLRDGDNEVTFKLADVGFEFWNVAEYQLANIRITGDTTDTSATRAETSFRINREEMDNLDEARLRFFVDCLSRDEGLLTLSLNNRKIFSAVPECGSTQPPLDITDDLRAGHNTLEWEVDQGSLSIYHIEVKTELDDDINPVYYFELSDSEHRDIGKSDVDAALNFTFLDNDRRKQARLVINGHTTYINTRDERFGLVLDSYLFEGTNALEIIPEDTLDIIKMKLTIDYLDNDD